MTKNEGVIVVRKEAIFFWQQPTGYILQQKPIDNQILHMWKRFIKMKQKTDDINVLTNL